jgi:cell division protein FtsW (lipid II flippase)
MRLGALAHYAEAYSGAFLPALLAYLALAVWAGLAWAIWSNAPPGAEPGPFRLAAAGAPAVIGYAELGQHPGPRSAAARHLLIDRADGQWRFGNRSLERRVELRTARLSSMFLQRWELKRGDRLSFDGAELAVMDADGANLVLRDDISGRQVVWQDGRLQPKDEPVHEVCRPWYARLLARAKWLSRTWLTEDKPEIALFGIGGGVNCSDRWRIDALPPEAVTVEWQRGTFWLAPGTRRYDVVLYRGGTNIPQTFTDLLAPLDGAAGRVESVILGRTHYRVSADGKQLALTPTANIDYWFDLSRVPSDYPRKRWIGAGADAAEWLIGVDDRLLPGAGAAFVAAFALAGLWWWRRRERTALTLVYGLAATLPAIMGSWLTVLLYRGVGRPDVMLMVGMAWLAWFWATFLLIWSRRALGLAGWLWFGGLALAATGVLTQLQLAAGAENSRWLGLVLRHAAAVAVFGWLVCLLAAAPVVRWQRLLVAAFNRESLAVGVALLLIGLIALQVVLGGEEGLAGIQPVELVKTVTVILLGFVGMHLMEAREREVRAYRRSPIRFLLPYVRFAGLFFLFVLSAVVGVRDFSPAVILLLVLLAWFWKVGGAGGRPAAGLWRAIRPAIAAAVLLVIAGGAYVHAHPEVLPSSFPKRERVLVWAQPALHPHSGSQVLAANERVAEGGWLGTRGWFGANGDVMDVPEIHNDFIIAFYLNRFGGLAGLALLLLQIVYLAALFALARQFERWAAAGDFRDQNAGRVIGFTVYGLAWLHIAHWTIAWANSLGLLPVMGQPMTWVAAGNSHLLGMAMPTLAIALIAAWTLRLKPDERPRAA